MHATEIVTDISVLRISPHVAPPEPAEVLPPVPANRLRLQLRLKRVMDVSLSLMLLVLTAPIVFLCGAIIRLSSPGPALYSQRRVGRFGRVFTIHKLRTMHHDCDRHTGPKWCVPGDPRVTRFGRFLRASHIDELPQLINVLRGEMSLVGPRPERPEIAESLAIQVGSYDLRSAVLPGITGHAQVLLPPDVTVSDVREKIRLDREYMRTWSLWADVVILFRTLLKVLGKHPREAGR